MTLDDINRAIAEYATERGLSRPRRLRVEFADPGESLDCPIGPVGVIVGTRVVDPVQDASQSPGDKEIPDRPPVPRGPSSVGEAIRLALFYANCRKSGQALAIDIQQQWPNEWSDGHIQTTASQMARPGGQLKNHVRDPCDDFGKGYGLVEWEPDPIPDTATPSGLGLGLGGLTPESKGS